MYEAKKVHNIIKEKRRMKVDIMGNINEIRWPGDCQVEEQTIFYTRNEK